MIVISIEVGNKLKCYRVVSGCWVTLCLSVFPNLNVCWGWFSISDRRFSRILAKACLASNRREWSMIVGWGRSEGVWWLTGLENGPDVGVLILQSDDEVHVLRFREVGSSEGLAMGVLCRAAMPDTRGGLRGINTVDGFQMDPDEG